MKYSEFLPGITRVTSLIVIVVFLQACATPIEIKQASRKQLELIDSLDTAVRELQQSVDQFHRDQANLIRIDGRVRVAKTAVSEATDDARAVTADELFTKYEQEIHPWIVAAFSAPAVDARIARIEQQIQRETDIAKKAQLTLERNDLKIRRATLDEAPETVMGVDESVRNQLQEEAETAADVRKKLELLRTQVALMKLMQTRVDDWLAIDVSPTQEQIDVLTKSIGEAKAAIAGGGS